LRGLDTAISWLDKNYKDLFF